MYKKRWQDIKSNKQFSNLFVYGIGQAFNLLTPLLVVPYIIHVCGEDGLGKIGIAMAFSFFLIVIIDYGTDIVGVKEVSVNRANTTKLAIILSTTYASKLLLLILVVAAASALFFAIPYFSREKELFFVSLTIVAGQFLNPTWVFQGIENFKGITFLNILSKLIYAAGVFIFIKQPGDYSYAVLWWGIGMIVANTITFAYLRSKYSISFSNTSVNEVRDFLRSNFSMSGSQVFVSLQLYAPILLIGFFAGDAMAGKYRIVEYVIVIFKTYLFLFFNFMYPRVCYLLETGTNQALRFWKLYNGINFIFVTTAMAALYMLAAPVVKYFTTESVEEVTGLLRLATFIPVVYAASIPLKQLVLGWNYQKAYIRITVLLVIINMALIMAFLPFYGIYGVLAAIIATEAATGIIYAVLIKNKLQVVN